MFVYTLVTSLCLHICLFLLTDCLFVCLSITVVLNYYCNFVIQCIEFLVKMLAAKVTTNCCMKTNEKMNENKYVFKIILLCFARLFFSFKQFFFAKCVNATIWHLISLWVEYKNIIVTVAISNYNRTYTNIWIMQRMIQMR